MSPTRDTIVASHLLDVNDARSIHIATQAGTVRTGMAKDGPTETAYDAGAFVLLDARHGVIAGPIDIGGALEIARAVVSGNPRAVTEPQALIVLATTLLAAVSFWPFSHNGHAVADIEQSIAEAI